MLDSVSAIAVGICALLESWSSEERFGSCFEEDKGSAGALNAKPSRERNAEGFEEYGAVGLGAAILREDSP
jgi:hypothetical protein